MMRRAAHSASTRPRRRRQTADAPPPAPADDAAVVAPRNVGSAEALVSLTLGVLMIVAALLPRTFRQLSLLTFGGALAYRGLTGNCGVYKAAGIDTARSSLPGQVGDRPKAAEKR